MTAKWIKFFCSYLKCQGTFDIGLHWVQMVGLLNLHWPKFLIHNNLFINVLIQVRKFPHIFKGTGLRRFCHLAVTRFTV